ncbi:MAG: ATP-dependent helicase [Proteobacteria bacterium]|nr:ATP-dependent helicase [Pseudomonadota bacterium]
MGFTQQQINAAKVVQDQAAHDISPQIRLVAGPGTGKSFSIGERVKWLINNGVNPNTIFAVSFTRAAAEDLQDGILKYCAAIPAASAINVSTLHSLALSILAKGGKLTQYPTNPRILDEWEQRNIFDEELKNKTNFSIKRCCDLRLHFEAIWSTGSPPLPFISSPTPPISPAEQTAFDVFHSNRTQLYSCILPGEAVRQCVVNIKAGILNPKNLVGIEHLIVDEYQDLNNCDVELIDIIASTGVTVLVSGDDDQSIYSFRYAYPAGIQTFPIRHVNSGQHALQLCFRCTPSVLGAATNLLANNASPNRIPKALQSAYAGSAPPVPGSVTPISFQNDDIEAQAIAQSVSDLIGGGLSPGDILILLSDRRAQLQKLQTAMQNIGVMLDVQQKLGLSNDKTIRFVYSMLRILRNADDYLAYRTILGLRNGVGVGTCVSISDKVLVNSLNYKTQFGAGITAAIFSARETNAINGVVNIINSMAGWDIEDLLGQRVGDIGAILNNHRSQAEANLWLNWANNLPADMSLKELEKILGARSEKEARQTMVEIYTRLNIPLPEGLDPSNRVRVMTLHSSKGLSSKVVFIPGLEEQLIPGQRRSPYPGQVQEAARLLYVGITRARADCIVSFAHRRFINGSIVAQQPSRFAAHLGVVFQPRNQGLSPVEVTNIINNCSNL